MHRTRPALTAALLTALLAGCPGGGGGSNNPPPPATFTVSGTISAAAGQVMDSDTGDVRDVPKQRNDTAATAQQVPGGALIGGFVGEVRDPRPPNAVLFTDAQDLYRTRMVAGQAAVLTISGAPADLELCLYTVAAPPPAIAVDCSPETGDTRTVTAPADSDFLVRVRPSDPAADTSNYVLTLGVNTAAAASSLHSAAEFVPGEVLVRFREGLLGPARAAPADELRTRAAALGLEPLGGAVRGRPALLGLGRSAAARAGALAALGVERRPGAPGTSLDELAAERLDTLRAIKALRRRPDVLSADPNYVFHPSATPPNQYYPLQWHYPLINLPQAWDVNGVTRGAGAVVAVIDTGVFLDHPDFAGRGQLVDGYDFISDAARARDGDGRDENPDDVGDEAIPGSSSWHGTHVSGTIAAAWRSGQGAVGVASEARVMPLRALGVGGGSTSDIIDALYFAAGLPNASGTVPARKADVINLSLGCLDCFSATEQAVYREVRSAGVIVVAAAGNENSTLPGYPASYDGVVSVSAVDAALARAPYSNRGPGVDLAAPGGNTGVDLARDGYPDGVLSAVVDDSGVTRRPAWTFYQGTSMASPHVAGVVALMKSVCPSLEPAQFDFILAAGGMTRELGAAGRDDVFGHGLVDALEAVQSALQRCGLPVPPGVEVNPQQLDFGAAAAPLTLTVTRTGGGDLPLSVTPATSGQAWLSMAPAAPGSVDANGFGTYAVTVDRTGLTDGRYSGSVRFTRSDGGSVEVPVRMQVGAPTGPGDAGYLYVLLIDSSSTPPRGFQVEPGNGAGGGRYPFSFTGVPAGNYVVVAGTDSDNDDVICDEGEVCGMWPTLGLPTPFDVSGDVATRDFDVALDVGLGGGVATAPAGGASGSKKLQAPAAKSVEVRR